MICAVCKSEDRTSRVYESHGTRTAMGWQAFYDEIGVYHTHDPNEHAQVYSCSNGHRWVVRVKPACKAPGCLHKGSTRTDYTEPRGWSAPTSDRGANEPETET